ncbi:bud site selection protein [Chytridiales sp. JEL 0842]|nr:bud site selection protein [Chytridiales sp. JEL 0842]
MTSKEYLAAKYMSLDKMPPAGLSGKVPKGLKVKKKKAKSSAVSSSKSGSMLVVDDEDDWAANKSDEEEYRPVMVQDIPAETKFKADSWQVIRDGEGLDKKVQLDVPATEEDLEDEELVRQAVYAAGGGEEWESQKEKALREEEEARLARRRSAGGNTRRTPSPSPSPERSGRGRRSPSPSRSPSPNGVSKRKRRTPSPSPSPPPNGKRQQPQPSELGQGAATIYRDKLGRKVDLAEEEAKNAAKEAQRKKEEEERLRFKGGVMQEKMREQASRRLQEETHAPLAVYKDNKEQNEKLKEIDRWGDPMAALGGSKKRKGNRPRYSGPPPPQNRFGIEPGYRWDGVDRGNGFESKYFQAKYARATLSEEAYKWSTEDM